MDLQHTRRGEVARRLCQSCEASSGEVDGVGLLLGQAAWPASTIEDWLCQCTHVLRPTTSLAAFSSRGRTGSPRKSVFQQDNAKIHTAKLMLSFFERYTVPLESHPVYSPDLNPIEHVWTLLKRQLQVNYPDLINYPGGPNKVKAKLAEVLPLCWEKIPSKQFEALWGSMLLRVQAVIDAKGWYTCY